MLPSDLGRAETPAELAAEAVARLGSVDILVNNAAVGHRAPTATLGAATVDLLYAVNVRAPLLLVASLLPGMVERGRGSIVNLSSVSGVIGTPNRAASHSRNDSHSSTGAVYGFPLDNPPWYPSRNARTSRKVPPSVYIAGLSGSWLRASRAESIALPESPSRSRTAESRR